jgi:hypothetical protein
MQLPLLNPCREGCMQPQVFTRIMPVTTRTPCTRRSLNWLRMVRSLPWESAGSITSAIFHRRMRNAMR